MIRDLMQLQDRMNRLFEQFGSVPRRQGEDETWLSGMWAPAVDIFEKEDAIVLKADLPEIDPKDVDIRVENNTLHLRGERKMETEVKEDSYHRVERAYGSFSRSFTLPHTVSADRIAAEYKNGVLRITMPKREESKPKQIKINVNQ